MKKIVAISLTLLAGIGTVFVGVSLYQRHKDQKIWR